MIGLKDGYNRKIDYLRISVTDRCNLSCIYCVASEKPEFLPQEEILTFEEITLIARAAVKAGIKKIRITGGEPLLRKGIEELISSLSEIKGLKDLSLTTNGMLLSEKAEKLFEAGLRRVNISLDTLNAEKFKEITRGGNLQKVLEGIDQALEVGLNPVKINTVLLDETAEEDVDAFIELVYQKPVHVRFIEKMEFDDDCGATSNVKCSSLIEIVSKKAELEETKGPLGYGPATYLKPRGAKGTIGFICPYSRHFCDRCNRLRLTADGKLRPCLFSDKEVDLKAVLRGSGLKEDQVIQKIKVALLLKPESFKHAFKERRRTMRQIGG